MASVRHPNVISYLGLCTEPACIVTEYCSKGSLTDVRTLSPTSPPSHIIAQHPSPLPTKNPDKS